MSYLVDTNVVSELRKKGRADRGRRRLGPGTRAGRALHQRAHHRRAPARRGPNVRRRDPDFGAALDRWVAQTAERFRDRILLVDHTVAERWGEVTGRQTVPDVDGLIGATALVHDLVVVTRNVRHVAPTGARCLDPFGGAGEIC